MAFNGVDEAIKICQKCFQQRRFYELTIRAQQHSEVCHSSTIEIEANFDEDFLECWNCGSQADVLYNVHKTCEDTEFKLAIIKTVLIRKPKRSRAIIEIMQDTISRKAQYEEFILTDEKQSLRSQDNEWEIDTGGVKESTKRIDELVTKLRQRIELNSSDDASKINDEQMKITDQKNADPPLDCIKTREQDSLIDKDSVYIVPRLKEPVQPNPKKEIVKFISCDHNYYSINGNEMKMAKRMIAVNQENINNNKPRQNNPQKKKLEVTSTDNEKDDINNPECDLEGPRKCRYCLRHLPASAHLIHFANQKQNKYLCKICGKGFCSIGGVTSHKAVAHNPNQILHACKYCGKSFGIKSNLTRHIRRVHGIH